MKMGVMSEEQRAISTKRKQTPDDQPREPLRLQTQKDILNRPACIIPSCRTVMWCSLVMVWLCMIGPTVIAQGATGEEMTVREQRLLPCPNSPNCVSTMETEEGHAIAPYRFQTSLQEAKAVLKQVFSEFPRTTLVKEEGDVLQFEVKSFLFRFVDDVEFWLDEASHTIHFRSASRSGYYDFGVNRKRMEDLRGMLEGKL